MTQLLHRTRPRDGRREDAIKVLAGVALGPAVAGAALVAVVVLLVLLAGGGEFDGAGAVTGAVWLAAHQVSLRIDGQPLGVLPLLPTLVLVLATARSVRAGVRQSGWSGDRVLWLGAAAVAGPVLVGLLAVVLLAQRPSLLPVEGVAPGPAIGAVVLVHGVGAALGVAGPSGRWQRWTDELPEWAWRSLALAPRALAGLLGGGALLLTASLVLGFGTVGSLYGPGASVGTVVGLTLVSLLYLPNAVVAATSVAVGPGVEIGRGSVTAVGVVGGPVPPLPLLGGLPGSSTSWLWLLVLVVPALAGAVLGRDAARRCGDVTTAARTVLATAGLVGVALALAGWVAGGRLGAGVFDPVHVPAALLGLIGAAWLAAVGCATVVVLLRQELRDSRDLERPDAAAADVADVDEAQTGEAETTEVMVDETADDTAETGETAADDAEATEVKADEATADAVVADAALAVETTVDAAKSDQAVADEAAADENEDADADADANANADEPGDTAEPADAAVAPSSGTSHRAD